MFLKHGAENIPPPDIGGQWEYVRKRVNTSAFWFVFSFLIFSVGTLFIEPSGINIRFAIMAREISECGLGVFPTVNHAPYPDYFSFWTLLSWIASFGGRNALIHCAWFVMLPTMICGAGTVSLAFRIAERFKTGSGAYA